jgi:hypothetical protein
MTEPKTTPAIARALKVPLWRIEHLIRDGVIPAPPQVGGVRLWPESAEAEIAAALAAREARAAARRRLTTSTKVSTSMSTKCRA